MPSPTSIRKRNLQDDLDSPIKKKLKTKLINSTRKLHSKVTIISKMKKKIVTLKTRNTLHNILHSHKFPSKNSKALVTMQLKSKKRPWTEDEKNFALSLFYKSPAAYKFLRLQKVNLPAPSTIRNWIGESKFLPGFNRSFLEHIKKKFEAKSYKEKACSVLFDEISIKEFLEYSKQYDFVEGFEDIGKIGRGNKTANTALVFMVRGIYSSWKFPIAYFLAHSAVKSKTLKTLIVDVIKELIGVGLCPKLTVCDQGTNNQSALKLLNVSEDKPYFFIDENKIFAIFDVPHLVKSIRNNLIGSVFKKDDKEISYTDIIDTYQVDKKNKKSRALLKITDAHIFPNSFQKMRVKFATQVFSHSMASTMRTCIQTKQLQNKNAQDTADFVDFMNKLFDCLNSRTLLSNNPYNCALSDVGKVKPFLMKASTYFTNMHKYKKGKMSRPPCFNGITQTINGILNLFEEEKQNGILFLLTNRFNQDILENLFSIFRQKGGYNKNPTARTLRTSFRSNCIFSLVTSKGTNCKANIEDLDEIQLQEQVSLVVELPPQDPLSSSSSSSSSPTPSTLSSPTPSSLSLLTSTSLNNIEIKEEEPITLEDCSVLYFAGYLAHRCIAQFNCTNCINYLLTNKNIDDKNQLLLLNKNYTYLEIQNDIGLKAPSKDFNNIINKALTIFEDKIKNILHKKK
ncbi:unnamed protein product [Macrosiphum euphorbiae]|uniref:Transposable element P transposase n=1 Tax=Macrosiphum euphorbiae TaxID=13131 RepID=A0AAV0XMD6_9HEMI|nr:unnamed protein product [Macrosiphum euphorbiae]